MMTVCRYDAINVAFRPPASVYTSTPSGMRNDARSVSMPVSAKVTSDPPRMSMDVTRMLVKSAKQRKTTWTREPQRDRMISRKVCAVGARRLTWIARREKSSTWMLAAIL
jgi:hypothetical protein